MGFSIFCIDITAVLLSSYTRVILPLVSYAVTILAGVLFFCHTHRLSDGIFRYGVDASLEAFHAVESEIVRLMSGNRVRQSWTAVDGEAATT